MTKRHSITKFSLFLLIILDQLTIRSGLVRVAHILFLSKIYSHNTFISKILEAIEHSENTEKFLCLAEQIKEATKL